jgi:hypothetical protein
VSWGVGGVGETKVNDLILSFQGVSRQDHLHPSHYSPLSQNNHPPSFVYFRGGSSSEMHQALLLQPQPSCSTRLCSHATRQRGNTRQRPVRPPGPEFFPVARSVAASPQTEDFLRTTDDETSTTPSGMDCHLAGARHSLECLYLSSRNGSGQASSSIPVLRSTLQTEELPPKHKNRNTERTPDYFANVGDAIRTLREEIPLLFQRDLNCKCSICLAARFALPIATAAVV